MGPHLGPTKLAHAKKNQKIRTAFPAHKLRMGKKPRWAVKYYVGPVKKAVYSVAKGCPSKLIRIHLSLTAAKIIPYAVRTASTLAHSASQTIMPIGGQSTVQRSNQRQLRWHFIHSCLHV